MALVLQAVDVAGPNRWRWLLLDEQSGVPLADHLVELTPEAAETEAFQDLYRFLRGRADRAHRVASEAELLRRVGTWVGSVVLGRRISRAIATAAPVTVRVVLPAGAEFMASQPLELADIGGVPMAARGDVALVYDRPGPLRVVKAPVGETLRILAVFSLPTATSAVWLRRERYELSRLVHRVALRGRRRVEWEVAQYGMTRQALGNLAKSRPGWDVLHLFLLPLISSDPAGPGRLGRGGQAHFLLARPDGKVDPIPTDELIELLYPLRSRVKLAVVSAGRSATVATAEMLCRLGLADLAFGLEAQAALESVTTATEIAQALTTQLGCAVVAMRYPVAEDFAVGFAWSLYDRLFRNGQPLDRAVAAAVPDAAGPAPSSDRPAISTVTATIFGTSAIQLSLVPPAGKQVDDPAVKSMAWFPPEAPRFVGRAETMAAACAALAPKSGCTAVVLHGMVGAGKTACAVELAYRYRGAFAASAYWSAPTDPDQLGDALRLLAVALDAQLGRYGFTMVDNITTPERLENFLPTITTILTDARLLLVLDNLEVVLNPNGQWCDLRWALLLGALTGHDGPSRVVLTSRIVPAGLNPDAVLVRSVHALSRDESLLLARELPNLRALLPAESSRGAPGSANPALVRDVLALVQGHPQLLELADAAAADPARLAVRLAAVQAATGPDGTGVDGAGWEAFLIEGHTRLDSAQFRRLLTAWTTDTVAALPASARLLLQVLCRAEETDRSTPVLRVIWSNLWRRFQGRPADQHLNQAGEPPTPATCAAPLVTTRLVTADPIDDPTDPNDSACYRIHSGIADIVHATTPEPVIAAVDEQLAAWWTAVSDWTIDQQHAGKDTSPLVLRAGLAAARYLLRQHDRDAASCVLERVLIGERYAPTTAIAVIPVLRRIAEATGALKDLVVLAAALRKVDPAEAETLLRRAYEQATTEGDHRLASTTAGDLVTLLRDQGRLREALTLAHQKIEHTGQAGFGDWTRLSDQGRRLQILGMLGHHEHVLIDLTGLRARMADLPDQRADNDRVNPWNVREGILDVGRYSAAALARWQEALDLNKEVTDIKRRRSATAYEIACTRLNDHLPLLRLGLSADADQLLRECQEVFDTVGDTTQLAVVHSARADLADKQDHPQEAVDLQRTALGFRYLRPVPPEIATAHHNLADYLFRVSGAAAEQRAHRLTAALLNHLGGDTRELTRTLGVLAYELRSDIPAPEAPAAPTTLPEVIELVDAGDGIRFGNLVVTLCPDPSVAEHALADLLATATALADQQTDPAPVKTDRLLTAWAPIITAVCDAATKDAPPAELADLLDDIATTDWAALAAALRRVLAGDRHRERLLAGLDDTGVAILDATLDRLPTDPRATR